MMSGEVANTNIGPAPTTPASTSSSNMNTLLQRKRCLDADLMNIEQQIHDLEASYIG